MLLRITSEQNPVAKPRMTRRDRWAQRPVVEQYWDFKSTLMAAALEQMYRPSQMDVYRIDAVVHLPMPVSWSAKNKQAHDGQPHRQKPDADNILKAICDALLDDDSRVWHKTIKKFWGSVGGLDLILHYEVRT